MEKNKIKILLIIVIIVQTVIYIIAGINKSYIHMDEGYSLGLASYDKVEIQDNEDFYNNWHTKDYYEDYLSVQDNEKGQYSQVYENQKNDVHPPLYYLFLRIAMEFSPNHFSKWPGITINIIIYMFITIFMYLILTKLIENQSDYKIKAIVLAFVSSIILASITNVIYIRMYALATLNILIITYLHIKLYEKYELKTAIFIGIAALICSLTHYFYLLYLATLYIITIIRYLSKKEIKNMMQYTMSLVIAAAVSLAIFPYSIQHMFFGYRGDGVISKLTDLTQFPEMIKNLFKYIEIIHYYVFNNILFILLIIIAGIIIYRKNKNIKEKLEISKYLKQIYIPTIVYFVLVAISSPWIELRYILPICAIIFILVIYLLYTLLKAVMSEKNSNIVIVIMLTIILISPIIFRIEPQETYSDRKEIVSKLQNELNLPTIYWFNSNNNRFLDDILLFSVIDESYVAKDIECNKENVDNILKGKDISKGIIVIINEDQENDEILKSLNNITNLNETTYLKRMNACDIYYLH